MSLHLNGNTIADMYVGGTKVGEAWLNGQKVYSSAPPVINYIFRDIDANGNLTLATGALEDASKITALVDYGLYYAFENCTGLTGSISFSNLTSIGDYGLRFAFQYCTGLAGNISFPRLTSIGDFGLEYTFRNCTGITEVHFKSSLSGNSECTSSNMGCTNATVYFDL